MTLLALFPYLRDHGAGLYKVPSSERKLWTKLFGIGFPGFGTASLYRRVDWILLDDALIQKDGMSYLDDYEVYEALDERGYSGLSGLSDEVARLDLVRHYKFTAAIKDYAKRHALTTKKMNMSKEDYEMDELDIGAAVGLLVLARALNIKKL